MSASRPQQQGRRGLEDYVGVHTRVEKFRAAHPTARLTTLVVKDEPLTVRCEIYLDGNESGIPNSSGMADESGGMGGRGSSTLEKVETAAVGRELAFLGYEVKEGIASREEMQKATSRPVAVVPSGDHGKLDRGIVEALGILRKKESDFSVWVKNKYETDSEWRDLSAEIKGEILLYLNDKVNKQTAV